MQPSLGRAPRATVRVRVALTCLLVCGVTPLVGSCMRLKPNGLAGGGGYSDSSLRSIPGVEVRTNGSVTTFRIPWSAAIQTDKRLLFKRMMENYVEALADMKKDLEKSKISGTITGIEKAAATTAYHDQIRELVEKLADDARKDPSVARGTKNAAENQPPDVYTDVSKQTIAQAYTWPQAIVLFTGANFTFTLPEKLKASLKKAAEGRGAAKALEIIPTSIDVFVSLMWVAKPYIVVNIDNDTKAEIKGADGKFNREWQMDNAMFLVPGVGPAKDLMKKGDCQAIGELKIQMGAGLLWGPFDAPQDLKDYWGLNFLVDKESQSGKTEGLFGRFMALGKLGKAPIFLAMLGNDKGCGSASMSVNLAAMMDPISTAMWIGGGGDPSKIGEAKEQAAKAVESGDIAGATAEFSL